jgi:hypothetical protein
MNKLGLRPAVGWTLLLLVTVHVALAAIWIAGQELPQGARDEFFIVEGATDVAYRLREGAAWEEIRRWVIDSYYPPLARLPGVAALLLGGGYDAMLVAQWLLWLPLLVAGTFLTGRKLAGDQAAVASVALLLAAPAITDGLHRYEPNLGATAASVCMLAAWLHSDDLRERRPTLLFGLFLGLGLMSDRLGVLPFAMVPVGLSLARTRERASLKGALQAAAVVLVLCGWWYLGFIQRFAHELLPQLRSGEISSLGATAEDTVPWLWAQLHYLVLWPDSQLGLVGGLLALAALVWATARWQRREVRDVLVFLVAGLVLFTVVPKRQVYYTAPLLPAATALAGAMLADLARSRRRWGVLVVALILLASVPSFLSVRGGLLDLNRGVGSWLLLGQSPVREDLVGHRYPLGGPPTWHGVEAREIASVLRAAGVADDQPIAVFTIAAQVSESFLVSLCRMERGNVHTMGITMHPDQVIHGRPAPAALVTVVRSDRAWPSRQDLVRAMSLYDGWDDAYLPLLDRMDELRVGATLVDQRPLAEGESIAVWTLGR